MTEDRSQAIHVPRLWVRLFVVCVIALAAFLLYRTLSDYSMDELVASVTSVPAMRVLAAGAFAAASYLCLTGFDYLALRYVNCPLPYPKVALASFTSLSIGHNVGLAALSSGAIRYRFYSRWGVGAGDVARLIAFCGATVGLGLMILGGVALVAHPDLAGSITGLGNGLATAAGIALLALAAAYLVLAATVRTELRVWRWRIAMPPFRLALGQVIVGPLNFAMVAACLHQTLSAVADVSYLDVAAAYAVANTAVLISHVPGGLGVIESVILFLIPQAELIGAILVFRFVYFLVPLCLGGALLFASEVVMRSRRRLKA